MAAMKVTEAMLNLTNELIQRKEVADSTANAYVKSLYILNGKVPFKTLSFLKDFAKIDGIISGYADNTQKALYTTIASVLSLYSDKPTYKKAYAYYYDKMMGKAKELKAAETSDKTPKESENWLSWTDVQKKETEIRDDVEKFVDNKHITPEQFGLLLHWVVLSLYTQIQPRRNQDYLDMFVVKKWKDTMSTDKNYLDLATHQFIFNKYKTQKTYGVQKLDVPDTLMRVINLYLKHHPLSKGNKAKATEYKFLVFADGSPLTAVNAITRILNRVFGRKIGSSALRHIFLSNKYDIKGMEEDAEAMGHSVDEQRKYLRKDGGGESDISLLIHEC